MRRGFVSVEGAERDYGVVIRDDAIDAEATGRQRAEMGDRSGDAFFGHSPGRVAFETRWTRSAYERLHELLWRLPVHWRFYAKHRIFESVEAAVDEGEAASEEMLEGAYTRLLEQNPELGRELASAG